MAAPEQQQQHGGGSGGSSGLGGSQFGDTTLTKIFVGGLAWETQRETMRRYFEEFGEILEAVVITDKNTGRSKGYGFVTFKDPESARRACDNPTPIIDGRRANCNLAALGVRPRFPPFHQGARFRHYTPVIGSSQVPSYSSAGSGSSFPQVPGGPFTYPQGAVSYAPYGYTYVPEYSYQSLYNPYGNPQLSAVYGSGGGTIGNPAAAVYTYSGFNQIGSTYPTAAAAAAAAAAQAAAAQAYGLQSPQMLQYPSAAAAAGGVSSMTTMSPYVGAVPISPPGPSTGLTAPTYSTSTAPVQQQLSMQPLPPLSTSSQSFSQASGGSSSG